MTIEELNKSIADGTFNEVVRVTEARQIKVLSQLTDWICASLGVRLVLLAGGSSAGKTTTAKRLATQLRVNGRAVRLLSTDDYFVGDARNPRDAEGKLDYEHVECVDIPALVRDLNGLFRGETVAERRFNFLRHEPEMTGGSLTLPAGGFVILEGIHALNPRLTEGIAEEMKFRLFVDPKPTLDIFGGYYPKASNARFLRRLVRDNQFRKTSPVKTLELWPRVLAGEQKWIEPFRAEADATFNSYLDYELAVLKPYAGGLLERARMEIGDQPLIVQMLQLLEIVSQASPEAVPGDSIVRETIGGSQLEY